MVLVWVTAVQVNVVALLARLREERKAQSLAVSGSDQSILAAISSASEVQPLIMEDSVKEFEHVIVLAKG